MNGSMKAVAANRSGAQTDGKAGVFFLLAIGGTWLFWAVPILAGWPVWEAPAVWFIYAGGACVPLAALLLTWWSGELHKLVRRLLDVRLVGARWWAFILLVIPAVHILSSAIAWLAGLQAEIFLPPATAHMESIVGLAPYLLFLLLLGPLPEEIGWRGYALPVLLERWSPVPATVLLAIAWGAWHVPLFFMSGYYEPFGGPPDAPLFFSNILIISFLYTWIFLHTAGSVLAAVLFHFVVNATGEFLPLSMPGEIVKTLALAAIAAALLSRISAAADLRRGWR